MTVKILFAVCFFIGGFFVKNPDRKSLSEQNKQFIYVLRYAPEFKKALNWTAKEHQIAREHVLYLKTLIDEGKGYMAGRTTNIYDPELFGIVIFDASNIEEAKEIMQNDPLIKNDVMQGTLSLFSIVFIEDKKR